MAPGANGPGKLFDESFEFPEYNSIVADVTVFEPVFAIVAEICLKPGAKGAAGTLTAITARSFCAMSKILAM